MKKYLYILILFVVLLLVFVFISQNSKIKNIEKGADVEIEKTSDFKNATFNIDGQSFNLQEGFAEIETAPGSASKNIIRYFGNDFKTDLNADGLEDVVFLATVESGGSGTFYYVLASLNTPEGFVGSDGYFLGDRIAPQNINQSPNPRHKNVIVVNYADRAKDEPMSAEPSLGKSVYLKMDQNNRWGIVVADFEGEAR